jgi:hypothetical protein
MKTIIFSILILLASCKPDEPIRKQQTTPPELRDTIIQWEKITDNEPQLIYC